MGSSICVRNAAESDYDLVIGNVNGWWGGRSMIGMLPRLFFQHFQPWTYVAEQHGAPVGFLAAFRSQSDERIVYCHFIGVSPEARGQGIGETLYERLFADAIAAGSSEVHAITSPRNSRSIAFHQRLGFEPLAGPHEESGTPYTPDYDGPGEARVRFRRRL